MMQTRHAMVLVGASLVASTGLRAEFALRDGDTVVFLGDSITAERGYGRVVENYTLLRYPQREVRFVNAGWGGDTAARGLERLERDVFPHGATVLTVAYGINDIGWGTKADDEHRQLYLDSIREIIRRCKQRNIRVFICSAAITAEKPETAENGFLTKMCDEGMALSRSLGEGAIDLQGGMREIQRRILTANAQVKDKKDETTLHSPDGIHLNDLGQLAMGFVMLKGLGAPAEVSSAVIDAEAAQAIEANGCRISEFKREGNRIEFLRLDEGLPLNFGPLGALNFRFIPIPDELNRYMLTVRNLAPGKYALTVDGRPVGTWTHEQWAAGVHIASATPNGWEPGGPWDAQAALLKTLTQARSELSQTAKTEAYYLDWGAPSPPPSTPADIARRETWAEHAADVNRRLEALQRETARPHPYHFVLTPAE